ncbi:carbon-nitrogen hydrolase family protein [Streptomyces sp. CB01881]|uniref:carbon-nitrogen hydrolase family protein n=1 Tax=Streptomyces sp. CB01881 TaxID=2078691 RepID=UPI0011DF12AC|nr:carbon-nitrogen hydrolase family protein [Streptomyces sp. CB01881]TYC68767.1 carbon-nitrogen hydrolase family protein [Streptomyces sp. CB01881]
MRAASARATRRPGAGRKRDRPGAKRLTPEQKAEQAERDHRRLLHRLQEVEAASEDTWSDQGRLVARYDKRFLSNTELSYLYTPGRPEPTVFEVDGVRFGLAICIEANFPALFAEYERLDVDCVLVSVMVDDPARATVAQAYGTLDNYWLGHAVPAQCAAGAPCGIVAPGGRWLHRTDADNRPALALADLDLHSTEADIDIAMRCVRPWRRLARADLYISHRADADPRSHERTAF